MVKDLILGITTIGDLLLKNKITQTDSGNLSENILLKIPEYQRPYKWTARNANQLLDDIEDARLHNKEVYRVGTLILHYDRNDGTYNIVDGQQRTITFSLILYCLEQSLKIHSGLRFLNQKLSSNPYNIHNVQNNFRSLKRRVDKITDERDRKELYDYILTQCELIVVITEDLSESFQFFDSQNARGRALYPHDLLKAYHLREMNGLNSSETEQVVKVWENLDQKKLSILFNDYLYRLKEWIKGNRAQELNEQTIDMFKGLNSRDQYPYAQYYKGAYAYADQLNHSPVLFVAGIQHINPFQIDAPVIAGKPFFEYTKHYFDILADIQNNDRYEGYLINDNEIIKTLDLRDYKNGVGNNITRLMLDTAILLYADRFCPEIPSKEDLDYLDRFVIYAFIWAYSLRAQYYNVGWLVAQNYILGTSNKGNVINSFNIYKIIADSDSPGLLLNRLADKVMPLTDSNIRMRKRIKNIDVQDDNGVYKYYLHYFKKYGFWSTK